MFTYGCTSSSMRRHDALCALAKSFSDRLSPSLKRVFEAASERGASGWLTTLPIADHGFAMGSLGMLCACILGGRF